jgi:hypothetical protein
LEVLYAILSKIKSRLTQFTIKRGERERKTRKEKKRPYKYNETPITTPPVPLERYQRDESNDTKEGHER